MPLCALSLVSVPKLLLGLLTLTYASALAGMGGSVVAARAGGVRADPSTATTRASSKAPRRREVVFAMKFRFLIREPSICPRPSWAPDVPLQRPYGAGGARSTAA